MARQSIVTLMVEREEWVMPPRGGKPISRKAHFLLPALTAEDASSMGLFPNSMNESSGSSISSTQLPLKVSFDGWRKPTDRWEQWVSQMRPRYQSLWEGAGISDAINSSISTIIQHKDVVLELSERWCSETKSFIFPWGEATITLEDVAVIGGYSLGGHCVLQPLESPALKDIENQLKEERLVIGRTKASRACQKLWMDRFMGSGSEIEHEAFLSHWLSRFVFPGPAIDTIRKVVFPVAIHLARGARIALAPAVLASLYRDLGLLKRREQISVRKPSRSRLTLPDKITMWAPFQLVQVWIWERFESLRPLGVRTTLTTVPIITKWHKAKTEGPKIENLARVYDRSGKTFKWRPYTGCDYNQGFMSELYKSKQVRKIAVYYQTEALQNYVRCIRTCELVGLEDGCIEQYLPQRVAMQFGLDQDIPVASRVETSLIGGNNYLRLFLDDVIYVPSRFSEPEVSTRYYTWLKRSIMIYLEGQTTNRTRALV
ncbi:protein MAIN-LIKE 2-like [Impatiens glandulifera]|uniref:protein MAIN-LIKE 2-like n=1 Tax=Impatiens glandulifera TaxID=253017 RepID=UPI001FB143C6|nr:protein MAIN-LIKE 2-like [Impatiens glandulifera]